MFIRRKTVKGLDYYQVIETYRDAGRVRHRTIGSLGPHPTPVLAVRACRSRVRHLRKELEFLSLTRHAGGRHERQCAVFERRLGKAETELAKLQDVAKRFKGK